MAIKASEAERATPAARESAAADGRQVVATKESATTIAGRDTAATANARGNMARDLRI